MSASYAELKSRYDTLKQASDLRIAVLSEELLVAKTKVHSTDKKRPSNKKRFSQDDDDSNNLLKTTSTSSEIKAD